jgi:hypothetical protein
MALDEFLDDVLISKELLDSILEAPIDERYSKSVDEFEAKVQKIFVKKSELNLSLNVKAVAELNQVYDICQNTVPLPCSDSCFFLS